MRSKLDKLTFLSRFFALASMSAPLIAATGLLAMGAVGYHATQLKLQTHPVASERRSVARMHTRLNDLDARISNFVSNADRVDDKQRLKNQHNKHLFD